MDLNQVSVEARDFKEAIDFYVKIGFRLIVSQREEYARFELPHGSATFSIHVSERPVPSSAVLYFEVEDVDRTYRELIAAGVMFDAPPSDQPWRWREAWFCDPTGNPLCIYHAGLDRRFPPWRIEKPCATS